MKHESRIFSHGLLCDFSPPEYRMSSCFFGLTTASHDTYAFSFCPLVWQGNLVSNHVRSPPDERQTQHLEAGYSLDSTDELGWPDINVPNRHPVTRQVTWVIWKKSWWRKSLRSDSAFFCAFGFTDGKYCSELSNSARLGLVQAIHRKTSIQRLCLIKSGPWCLPGPTCTDFDLHSKLIESLRPKHELPPNTGPKEAVLYGISQIPIMR